MSFRAKIIFFGVIGILIIVGLILALVFRSPKAPLAEEEETLTNVSVLPGAPTVPAKPTEVKKPLSPAELSTAQKELALRNRVKIFVERFGSWSPGANFANFDELEVIVTASVASWLEEYKKKLVKEQAPDFAGVTTRLISQKNISKNETQASVMASVQREEVFGATPKISYRDMMVKLVWQNGEWLIDGAYWQ